MVDTSTRLAAEDFARREQHGSTHRRHAFDAGLFGAHTERRVLDDQGDLVAQVDLAFPPSASISPRALAAHRPEKGR